MDCTYCKKMVSERSRAGNLCYWVSKRDRDRAIAPAPLFPPRYRPTQEEQLSVCAGALIHMPQVIEAARAFSWREKGALREFYDGQRITRLAKTCIDVFAHANVQAQNDAIRSRSEG